jgi:exopolyphosphatase/guanosine-5'-triphosphate,3'-diphosphate pyrophosphatase
MHGFRHLIRAHEVDAHAACATSAMREAANGDEVRNRIRREAGIELRIISGRQEARIIYANRIAHLVDPEHTTLYVDVGGGSCELTLFHDEQMRASESFRIGTVRLIEKGRDEDEWQRMKKWVKEKTRDDEPAFLIGSGGNINKLIKLIRQEKGGDKFLHKKELEEAHDALAALTVDDRMVQLNLSPDRADVIVPAAAIYLAILRWSACKEIYVPKVGLADGMCRELYRQHVEAGKTP